MQCAWVCNVCWFLTLLCPCSYRSHKRMLVLVCVWNVMLLVSQEIVLIYFKYVLILFLCYCDLLDVICCSCFVCCWLLLPSFYINEQWFVGLVQNLRERKLHFSCPFISYSVKKGKLWMIEPLNWEAAFLSYFSIISDTSSSIWLAATFQMSVRVIDSSLVPSSLWFCCRFMRRSVAKLHLCHLKCDMRGE